MPTRSSRRRFVKTIVAAGAAAASRGARAQESGRIGGFDHVALPMQNTDAMLAFYRSLGCQIRESTAAVSVYVGPQMINFHRPRLWQDGSFTLRAPAAKPPCGDFCFVWDGTPSQLKAWLDASGARVEEGRCRVPVDGKHRARVLTFATLMATCSSS